MYIRTLDELPSRACVWYSAPKLPPPPPHNAPIATFSLDAPRTIRQTQTQCICRTRTSPPPSPLPLPPAPILSRKDSVRSSLPFDAWKATASDSYSWRRRSNWNWHSLVNDVEKKKELSWWKKFFPYWGELRRRKFLGQGKRVVLVLAQANKLWVPILTSSCFTQWRHQQSPNRLPIPQYPSKPWLKKLTWF